MAQPNNLLEYNKVANEALFVFQNTLGYAKRVNTEYRKEYTETMHGTQITVPKPPRYTVRTGDAAQIQSTTQESVVVTIQEPQGVDLQMSQKDMDLIMGSQPREWSRKIVRPGMGQLSSTVDHNMATQMRLLGCNFAGTRGTNPTTLADLAVYQERLSLQGVPTDMRYGLMGSRSYWALTPGLTGNFVRPVIDRAEMYGRLDMPILGLENGIAETQSAPTHTVGTFTGTPVVKGGGQFGDSLVTEGWTAGDTLNPGDLFTIALVFGVNYQTREAYSRLRQFVNTSATTLTADANGEMTIPVYPPISPPIGGQPQQFQTVDAYPANGAALTIVGTSGQRSSENMVAHRDAAGLITIPMFLDDEGYCERVEDEGIGMRMWVKADIQNNRKILRLDILAAYPIYYGEALCRGAGA